MANDDFDLNENQKVLLGLAGFSFFMYLIMIDDDDSILCCCTTIFLLIGIPLAAANNSTNISSYQVEKSSTNIAISTREIKRKNREIIKHKKKTFPREWFDLKEIYPKAEIDEYSDYENFSSGNWDMEGLRGDLKIMIERTGKKPSKKKLKEKQNNGKLTLESMEHSEFKKAILAMNNSQLRKILKSRGLPVTGVKSRLIARLVDYVKEKKETKENDSENNDKEAKNKRKVNKKVIQKMKVVKPKEEKTTTIECPDCSAIIEIPDVPGMQEVQCPECGINGEIEL